MKIYKIYKITNVFTGKSYVGATSQNPAKRFAEHVKNANYRISNGLNAYHFQKVLHKYGKSAFIVETIEDNIAATEVDTLERLYIALYGDYNSNSGGRSGFTESKETLAKKSISQIGRFEKPEERAKLRKPKRCGCCGKLGHNRSTCSQGLQILQVI